MQDHGFVLILMTGFIILINHVFRLKTLVFEAEERVDFLSIQTAKICDEFEKMKEKLREYKATIEVIKRDHLVATSPIASSAVTGSLSNADFKSVPVTSGRLGYINGKALVLPDIKNDEMDLVLDEYTAIDVIHQLLSDTTGIIKNLKNFAITIVPTRTCSMSIYEDKKYGDLFGGVKRGEVEYRKLRELIHMFSLVVSTSKLLKKFSVVILPISKIKDADSDSEDESEEEDEEDEDEEDEPREKEITPVVLTKEMIMPLCWAIPQNETLKTFAFHGVQLDVEASAMLASAIDQNTSIEEVMLSRKGNEDNLNVTEQMNPYVSQWEQQVIH